LCPDVAVRPEWDISPSILTDRGTPAKNSRVAIGRAPPNLLRVSRPRSLVISKLGEKRNHTCDFNNRLYLDADKSEGARYCVAII